MVSAGCLTLGLIYLRFWFTEHRRRDYLAFLFICLSAMLFSWCELGMLHSSTPEEFIFWARSSHIPSAGAVISIAWFAHLALAGRRWLFFTICVVRLLTLTLNYVFPNGINFREIKSIQQTQVFGETLSYAIGVPNPWTLIATSTFVLLIIYSIDASLRAWRRDDWRSTVIVSSGVCFFGLVALFSPLIVIFGILKVTFFSTPAVFVLIGIMLSKLNNDLHQSAMLTGSLRVKEQELTEMLQMFNLSAEAASVGMWMKNFADDSFWVSGKMRELFELPGSQPITLNQFVQKVHPDDRQVFLDILNISETLNKEYQTEYRVLLENGTTRWIGARGKGEFVDGKPKLIRGAMTDITQRKLADESLREQEELLRRLVQNLPNGSVNVFDRNFRYLLGEGTELEKLGLSNEFLKGKTIWDVYPKEMIEYCLPFYDRVFEGETVQFQLEAFGQVYGVCAAPLRAQDEYTYAVLVLVQNITDIKQNEEELRQMSGRLLNLQEEERKRLARDLHDDLSQRVALLSFDIAEIRHAEMPSALHEKLDSLSSTIEHFAADIHRISHDIHPAKLGQLGLAAALRGFCREMSKHHSIKIEFIENKELPPFLNEDVSLCLYRITQEAVQNAIKHSGASLVTVRINIKDDNYCLLISDNGCGFDTEAVKAKDALGLISIQERVRAVNGTLKINSKIGAGTKIEACAATADFFAFGSVS
jgi:PAS domain S-box-containing protein